MRVHSRAGGRRNRKQMISTQAMRSRLVRARSERWIGGLGSVGTLVVVVVVVVAVVGVAFAGASVRLRAVGWANETLPGAVCKSQGPIRLEEHVAQIAHTGFGNVLI